MHLDLSMLVQYTLIRKQKCELRVLKFKYISLILQDEKHN